MSIAAAEKSLGFDLTEIINEEEVVLPSPLYIHQEIVANLYDLFRQHVKKHKNGIVAIVPLDVILEEDIQRVQPDLLFISNENKEIIQDWIRGVPDLVVEVVSPGSFLTDTVTKKAIYEKFGVKEYWVVIPELKSIQVFSNNGNQFELTSSNEVDGSVTSKLLEKFVVNLKDVFTE